MIEKNKKELMLDALQERENILQENYLLKERISNAEQKILALEEEREKIKQLRPGMLAEEKDVSKINRRLRRIDEEIDVCQDTIVGVTEKIKKFKREIYTAKVNANRCYKDYIDEIIATLKPQYTNAAKNLIKILNEYITLENIRDGNDFVHSKFNTSNIREIPDLDNDTPLFKYHSYNIYKNNQSDIHAKYDIPVFQVEKISINECK